jgi:integration host factor subunit beta
MGWKGGVTVNKAELATEVAQRAKVSHKVAKVVIDAVFEEMVNALRKGDRVEIRGFGSFVIRNYEGYQGRNPKTGASVNVPPKRLPYFKTGKELKERVDAKK